MDIRYKVFTGRKKCMEIECDDAYAQALKLIGARKFQKAWTLNRDHEDTLRELIKSLGGDPDKQREMVGVAASVAMKAPAPPAKAAAPPINVVHSDDDDDQSDRSGSRSGSDDDQSDRSGSDDDHSDRSGSRSGSEDDHSDRSGSDDDHSDHSDHSDSDEENLVASRSSQSSKRSSSSHSSHSSKRSKSSHSSSSKQSKSSHSSTYSSDASDASDASEEEDKSYHFSPEKGKRDKVANSPMSRRERLGVREERLGGGSTILSSLMRAAAKAKLNQTTVPKTRQREEESKARQREEESKARQREEESKARQREEESKARQRREESKARQREEDSKARQRREDDSKAARNIRASQGAPQTRMYDESMYRTRYNTDKLRYYQSLGHRHFADVEENSTSFSDSSDDFPSPDPPKRESKYSEEEVRSMQKRLRELEKMVRK